VILGMSARAPTPDERAQLQAALADVLEGETSVTQSTPTPYGDTDVDEIAAFFKSDPIMSVADCGARLCKSFGHGSEDPVRATASRMLRGMRGDKPACQRYCKYLAITRALKGTDLLIASFSSGSCAEFWASAGFLFRSPTHRHIKGGKRPVMVYAPIGVEPAHVMRVPKQQLYACLHYQLELYLATERERKESGHVLIFDLAEFGWKHLHRRFLTAVVQLVGVLLKNYPEMIHKLVIINAPSIFSIAWAAILPFANEHVQSKISISRGPNTEVLLDLVGAEGLPSDLGGTSEEPMVAHAEVRDDQAWTEVEILAGKTEKVVVTVDPPAPKKDGTDPEQCSLAVEFTVESAEISFFVVREPLPDPAAGKKAPPPEQEYALEPETYQSSDGPVTKLVEDAKPGTYTCVWDNTQAWRYSRKISYRVVKVFGEVPVVEDGASTEDSSLTAALPEWDGLSDAEMAKLASASA